MSYYLMLDDIRTMNVVRSYTKLPNEPDENWIIIRNYNEFVDIITLRGVPQFVCFDHDLGPSSYSEYSNLIKTGYIVYEMTGLDCSKWLINYCFEKNLPFPEYTVHSMNPIGKQNIISLIESYKKYYFTNIQNL